MKKEKGIFIILLTTILFTCFFSIVNVKADSISVVEKKGRKGLTQYIISGEKAISNKGDAYGQWAADNNKTIKKMSFKLYLFRELRDGKYYDSLNFSYEILEHFGYLSDMSYLQFKGYGFKKEVHEPITKGGDFFQLGKPKSGNEFEIILSTKDKPYWNNKDITIFRGSYKYLNDSDIPVFRILDYETKLSVNTGSYVRSGFTIDYENENNIKKINIKKDNQLLDSIKPNTVNLFSYKNIKRNNREKLIKEILELEKLKITGHDNYISNQSDIIHPYHKNLVYEGMYYFKYKNVIFADYNQLILEIKGKIDNETRSSNDILFSDEGEYEIILETTDDSLPKYVKKVIIKNEIPKFSKAEPEFSYRNSFIIQKSPQNIIKDKLEYRYNNGSWKTIKNLSSDGLADGKYDFKLSNTINNNQFITIILDTISPILEIKNINNKDILSDGAHTNAPFTIKQFDKNSTKEGLVKIEEIVSGAVVKEFNTHSGNFYFDPKTLIELEEGNNFNFSTYKLGNKEYKINSLLYTDRNHLLTHLTSSINLKIIRTKFTSEMNLNFIDDKQKNLAKVGKPFFLYDFRFLDRQESIKSNALIIKTVQYASVERDKLIAKLASLMNENIYHIQQNAFYIGQNQKKELRITVKDQAGNETVKTIILDTIVPSFNITGKGEYYIKYRNENVYINNGKEIYVNMEDPYTVIDLKDNSISKNQTIITLKDEGIYKYKIIDRAGNIRMLNIIIDNTPIQIKINEKVYFDEAEQIYYTNDINNIKFIDNLNINILMHYFDYENIKSEYKNDDLVFTSAKIAQPIMKHRKDNTPIKKVKIKIVAIDYTGNGSTFIIIIDITTPTYTLTSKNPSIKVFREYKGIIYANTETYINLDDEYTVINLKDNSTSKKQRKITVVSEGVNSYKLINKAQNEKVVTVFIDKTFIKMQDSKKIYFDKTEQIYYTNDINSIKLIDDNYIYQLTYNFEYKDIKEEHKKEVVDFSTSYINLAKALIKHGEDTTDIKEVKVTITAVDISGNINVLIFIVDKIKEDKILINNSNNTLINRLNTIQIKSSGQYPSNLKSIKIKQLQAIIDNKLISVKFKNYKLDKITTKEIIINDFKTFIQYKNSDNTNGKYEIIVEDMVGNKSSLFFTIFFREHNYSLNEDNIKNEFKKLKHYIVDLPSYLFGERSGKYSFISLDKANEFARNSEFNLRVLKRDDGFIYISKSNPTVAEFYKDEEKLQETINFYASNYVSDEIIYKNTTNHYYTIKDENLLNDQNIQDVNGKNTYRIKKTYKFIRNKNILNIKTNIKMVLFDIDTNSYGEVFEIDTNNTIGKQFKDIKMQGYYLVFEEDEANIKEYNIENANYIIFYDNQAPFILAETKKGNDTLNVITLNEKFVKENTNINNQNILRYTEFKITNIDDEEDRNFVILKIRSTKLNSTYSVDDISKIPTLNFENGYFGEIQITLYDRNFNSLNFHIYIAGYPPKVVTSNLEDTRANMSIRFSIDDALNTFKSINIYKYALDSEDINKQIKTKLTHDSNNNKISAKRKTYEFSLGGKYQIEYEDIFGRKYIDEPIYFTRNLPFARLIGVNKNGWTNRSVTIVVDNSFEVHIFKNIETKIDNSEIDEFFDGKTNRKQITVKSIDGITDNQYTVLLIDINDRSLFNEYNFGIDAIIGEYIIEDIDGEKLKENSATNKNFKIYAKDSSTKINVSKTGSIGYYYKKGDIINISGEYRVEIIDYVGNTKTFIILLDKEVKHEIKGRYKVKKDNSLISNEPINILLLEKIKRIDGNTNKINQGKYSVSKEGINEIEIEDLRGNIANLIIIIDITNPKYELNIKNESITNKNVTITIEDGATIDIRYNTNRINNNKKVNKLTEDGKYDFIITDEAGNISKGFFTIDKLIKFKSNIKFDNYYITDDIYIHLLEDAIISVEYENKKLKNNDTGKYLYKNNGKYKFTIKDEIGNIINLNVIKIPKVAKSYKINIFKNQSLVSLTLNKKTYKYKSNLTDQGQYEFNIKDDKTNKINRLNLLLDNIKPKIDIKLEKGKYIIGKANKARLEYKLFKDGKEIKFHKNIKDPGKYKLIIEDEIGNISEYKFKLKNQLTIVGIIFIGISIIFLCGISGYFIYRRKKIKVS